MFKLRTKEKVSNFGEVCVYDHSTGCRLIYVANEDNDRVFTIGFNTLPHNDKGIAHIVEHCVLCGSENFRVKDPFNLLDKGSIHTYLNASTYRDKTVYPVASTNEADFKTFVKVYCDGVFRPLMYTNEGIFRQEGWNSDGENYNGIVLNEMKGVYSDPETVLSEKIGKYMYEGSGYDCDSGGNPDDITDLTYEEFLDFHRTYYHPSNAVMYLYGNINIEEYLELIDKEYLCDFDYRETITPTMPTPKKTGFVEVHHNSTGKNILSAVFDTGDSTDPVKNSMLGILSGLLGYSEGGNVKDALINAGLGDKVSCSFESEGMRSNFEVTVENSDEINVDRFREVLNNVFKDIAENGVDDYKLRGIINSIEFFFMEEDFGYKPKGLFYGLLLINSFLKGRETTDFIKYGEIFNKIHKVDIKKLFKDYFVDKGCYGILIAEKDLKADEKPPVKANNQCLLEYQSMEDSPDEVRKLTSTKVSDISKTGFELKYDVMGDNLFVPVGNGDIVYADIYFDITGFENTKALNFFKLIASKYDEKISNDLDYYAGGFSIYCNTLNRDNGYRPVLSFRIKCLKENFDKCIELFKQVIFQDFTDITRFSKIVAEEIVSAKRGYVEYGSLYAIEDALGQVSRADSWNTQAKGIAYYEYLNSDVQKLMEDINSIKEVFKKGNAFYSCGISNDERDYVVSRLEKLLNSLPEGGSLNIIYDLFKIEPKAIIIDGQVNFNAVAFAMDCSNGVSRIVEQIISREYIWDKIRLEGGAYGGACGFYKNSGYMYSFRDPKLKESYEAFKLAGKYIAESNYSQEDIDRFIIGTINDIDKPIKNPNYTRLAMAKHFRGEKKEISRLRRKQILTATPDDIRAFGVAMANAPMNGICTVGQEKDIKSCEFFKEFYRIS